MAALRSCSVAQLCCFVALVNERSIWSSMELAVGSVVISWSSGLCSLLSYARGVGCLIIHLSTHCSTRCLRMAFLTFDSPHPPPFFSLRHAEQCRPQYGPLSKMVLNPNLKCRIHRRRYFCFGERWSGFVLPSRNVIPPTSSCNFSDLGFEGKSLCLYVHTPHL